jgi:glycosyltransferase involved in cell wall biosynthesis
MRIIIATTHVPFIRGGAEVHAEGLRDHLKEEGHDAEIVAVPFKWYPPQKILDHMLACRLFDLSEVMGTQVDLLIGLKFPAYLIPHPRKVLWILHQFRTAYELWDHDLGDLIYTPEGAAVRDAIREADRKLIPEARRVFANSGNVAARLKYFCGIDATPLYHPPPNAKEFYTSDAQDYIFFPSRLCLPKRQSLVLEALAQTKQPVRVKFAGAGDQPGYENELRTLSQKLGIQNRVDWLGQVTEEQKRDLYARSLAVIYPPLDEDYGYVTLESMLASKPVITCADSGGPLEFVRQAETGLIADPTAESLARALDSIWDRRSEAKQWGEAGREVYEEMGISWTGVIDKLLS